nr:hypothetical protein [Tanacetum cinerariifolium]
MHHLEGAMRVGLENHCCKTRFKVTRSELAAGGVDFNQIRPLRHVSASYGRRLYGLQYHPKVARIVNRGRNLISCRPPCQLLFSLNGCSAEMDIINDGLMDHVCLHWLLQSGLLLFRFSSLVSRLVRFALGSQLVLFHDSLKLLSKDEFGPCNELCRKRIKDKTREVITQTASLV